MIFMMDTPESLAVCEKEIGLKCEQMYQYPVVRLYVGGVSRWPTRCGDRCGLRVRVGMANGSTRRSSRGRSGAAPVIHRQILPPWGGRGWGKVDCPHCGRKGVDKSAPNQVTCGGAACRDKQKSHGRKRMVKEG